LLTAALLFAASATLATLVVAQLCLVIGRSRTGHILATWRSDDTTFSVRDGRRWRELVADDGVRAMVHSRIDKADTLMSGLRYTDGFHLAVALGGPPRRVLFIGGGGAIGPRQFAAFYPAAEIEVVEVDAGVLRAARRFFELPDGGPLRAHLGDGRTFTEAAPDDCFDVVVLDAYGGAGRPVEHLASEEFFAIVRRKLRAGGVLCANLVGDVERPEGAASRAASAIGRAFGGEYRLFAVPGQRDEGGNCLAVAARQLPTGCWEQVTRRARTLDRRVRFAAVIARRSLPPSSARRSSSREGLGTLSGLPSRSRGA
jgi:spermidine synthase